MTGRRFLHIVLVLTLLTSIERGFAQGEGGNGWGGVTDVFNLPVGANAMAMGGAYVAVTNDPFALYWNPAALENVEQMSLGLYYTNLPAGTQYNYLAFVYPTLTLGTFSTGILRLSTGDIPIRDDDPLLIGTLNYGRTLFLFGYGFRLLDWFSLGTTFKLERVELPGYPDGDRQQVSVISESGFGADLGLLFTPNIPIAFLENLTIGVSVQNLLQRSIRAVDERENSPRNFRIGIAKTHYFTGSGNHFKVSFEIDQSDVKINGKRIPTEYHFGTEYGYRNNAMIRFGFDYSQRSDGTFGMKPTYGVGAKMAGIELDYSYWNGYDAIMDASSHRISLTFNIGKTRKEKLAELHARELRRIEEEIRNRRRMERANAIVSGIAKARLRFSQGDYERAFITINRVLALDQTGNDPDLSEARTLAERINRALEEKRRQAIAEALKKSVQEQQKRRQEQMIEEHYNKALGYYESEDYIAAIEECDRALEIDPNLTYVKDLRNKVERDLKEKILKLSDEAERLARANRILDAIGKYSQALQLTRNYDPLVETRIEGRMHQLESRLNYEGLVRRAVTYENEQNWAMAAEAYKEALKYEPNNRSLQKKYNEAYARANAKKMKMTKEVDELYNKGLQAFYKEQFDEALNYFEQARKIQPLNETLLKAIDLVRERQRKKQAATDRK